MRRHRRALLGAAALVVGAMALPALVQAEEKLRDGSFLSKRIKKALEFERTDAEIRWANPETGNRGKLKITRTYFINPTSPCRDYIRTFEEDGAEPIEIKGTGCRDEAKDWRLTEDAEPKSTVSRPADPKGAKPSAASGDPKTKPATAKPTDLTGAKPPAGGDKDKAAGSKTAEAKPEKKAAPKPPPLPKIPSKIPQRSLDWETVRDDG